MSKKEKVNVVIDTNEEAQNIECVELFVLHEDVENFEIKPLDTGDFEVEDCVFERKTPSDFASSMEEGRLEEQVNRLAGHSKEAYILIEGNMEDFDNLEHTGIPSKSLRGMDAVIEGRHGISVKYCSNAGNLADIAVRIARKTIENPSQVRVSNSNTVKDAPFIVNFFMNVEGIGLETAEKLAEEFTTVQEAIEAAESDFKNVDGVGDVTAAELYKTLHNESSEEPNDSGGVTHVTI